MCIRDSLRAMEKGWRKKIVVLTRNAGYRKKPPHAARALYQAAYTKYPELLKTLLKRARMYNRTLAAIEKWEREGRIFVIRPQMKAIGRLESDPRLLEAFYRDGYEPVSYTHLPDRGRGYRFYSSGRYVQGGGAGAADGQFRRNHGYV